MAATTVQAQATALLQQSFAESKIRGTPAPQVESPAVLETIATSLLLNPRASLYVALLARNGLAAAVTNEIALVDALTKDVQDLGNITYDITDTSALQTARTSLISLENQQRVSSSVGAFKIYDNSVSKFLNTQLARNVKAPGATSLVRPGSEAATDLGGDFITLKTSHTDVLDRLYSLAVGVQNFLGSPLGSIIGAQTASRSRRDIESMIAQLQSDPSGAASRDITNRLITARAALKLMGSAPVVTTPVLDTALHLPTGYSVIGSSQTGAASTVSQPGPFTFSSGDSLSITVNGTTITKTTSTLVQPLNQPAVFGTVLPGGTAVIQPYYCLFLKIMADPSQTPSFVVQPDGTYTHPTLGPNWNPPTVLSGGLFSRVYRAQLNPTASPVTLSTASIVSLINGALGAVGQAVELAQAGSNQILIYGYHSTGTLYVTSIAVAVSNTEPDGFGNFSVFNLSAHSLLGFQQSQFGLQGTTASLLQATINVLYAAILTVTKNTNETLTFNTVSTDHGTSLSFSGSLASGIGLHNVVASATNTKVTFSGTVLGVQTSPVNPIGIMDIGDILISATGQSSIASISASSITLATPLPTFSGAVSVMSALYSVWATFNSLLQSFLVPWSKNAYSKNLNKIDSAVAVLKGEASPAQRNNALALLTDLRSQLSSLSTLLAQSQTLLPTGAGTKEQKVVQGILTTFDERKYDKAKDLFLRCKIQDVFQMDYQSLSYGGALMKASANIARTDVKFVNTAKDEGGVAIASQPRSGLK